MFDDSLGGFTDSAYSPNTHSYDLLQWKYTQHNQWREKAHVAKSKGNQVEDSKNPFPVKSLRTHLIPLVMSCDNTYEMLPTREDP